MSASATGVAFADPVQDAAAVCDPIDQSDCLLPWPNDYFTTADASTATALRLNVSPLATPRNAAGTPIDPADWNRLDGFSPGSQIVTHVAGMDNPRAFTKTNPPTNINIGRSLKRTSPVIVLDATTGKLWPVWSELDRSRDLNGNPPPPDRTGLLIHPAKNFAEGHRYIVALQNMRDSSGNVIPAQPAFATFLAGEGQPTSRQSHYDTDIFPQLRTAGINTSSLYLAWDFTVASQHGLSEPILHMRNDALAKLGDTTPGDGVVNGSAPQFVINTTPCTVTIGVPPANCTGASSDPRVLVHVDGYVVVPCYLNAPGCPSGSRFQYLTPSDVTPTPIPGNVYDAHFECNIPIGAARGEKFRVALVGHGLFGTADEINNDKYNGLGQYGVMSCASDEIGMAEEDIPNALASLADLSDFPTIPDRLQQGMIDFLYLGRDVLNPAGFCSNAAFQVNGKCVIDTSHLFYDGGSQGAIFGGALTATDPDFTRSELDVAGMNYSMLLTRSSDFTTFAEVFYRTYPDPLDRELLYSFIQNVWDHGEADGYAEHMTTHPLLDTPRHSVFMTVAFGDHQVTNWASEVEARTIGARIREPVLDPGRYPGPTPYWRIPPIRSYPYTGPAAMVVGDLGPLRACPNDGVTACSGSLAGTPPPPLDNNANIEGVDPHGPDWAQSPEGIATIAQWLSENGELPAICGTAPCYMAGWTGP
ncbi:MAG: hypothetical protein E6G34_08805 [Actinobacteria bacterium]|nr:MAG: hypothetical protein E6G34_08805 [Actinomycetota bacterium]